MSATASSDKAEYSRPAILDRILDGGHKVIDASAGTGKTLTIERIVIDLVLTGAATIDRILIVTFTEKATAELRARLRTTIESTLSDTLTDIQRERLNSALSSFHLSPIHTIHSFCHRMLTDLAFDSGVRFGLDLASGRREFHEAMRSELRERLKSDARVDRLVTEWLSDEKRTAETLEDLLWQAHSQRYLRTSGRELNQQSLPDLLKCFDADALADAFRRAAIKADARAAALEATRELDAILRRSAGSTAALADALRGFDFDPICKPQKTSQANDRFRDSMPPRARTIVDAALHAQAAFAIEPLAVDELLPAVASRMDARKRERGTLDYEDMLAWLAGALDGPRGQALAATMRARYCVTLIDEFQDTDQLQWKIFREVFVEGGDGNTVFVIGDPKQAIYSFRGADVHAYIQARDQLARAGAGTVNLRDNFRSTSAVIDACNLIFDQTAESPLFTGEIKYDPPARCGRPALRATGAVGNPIAPLTLVKFEPHLPRYKNSHWMRQAVGNRIANAIRQIIYEPQSAIRIADDDGRTPREIRAQNIYVLTRSRRDSVEISKHLRAAGVPFAFYKQDGLFQTREAAYILDVLRGIDQAGRRSCRLRAWATPFFAVDYSDLARLDEERSAHPMLERLFEWRALAEVERFADLFDALLHQSGLAERLLLSDSRRELSNYEHIFELLTRDASRRGVSLAEIICLLEAYIDERATPPGDDQNIQRVETDRDAVQIMTIHKSKGLEADVVALYGGFFARTQRDPVCVYHCGNERRLAIGKAAQSLHDDELKQEQAEEDQRLLYVAVTRARAKLILPYIPAGTLGVDLRGSYKQLNDRLRALECDDRLQKLADTEIAPPPQSVQDEQHKPEHILDDDAVCEWLASTSTPSITEREFDALRRRHPGLVTESYTSLQASDPEDFKTSVDAADARTDNLDLPGGRRVGIFLHEALERLDFDSFGDTPDFESWMARADVRELFSTAMRRHGVSDPRWLDRGREVVFNALTARIALGDVAVQDGLYRLPKVSEMEFVYPIPESHHPMLDHPPAGAWTVDRGYIKGFIDLVFRRGDLMYFADWKGDRLPSYEPEAVARHVATHYRLQAQIYSVGVMRMLGIHSARDYQAKFGGLLYVFLRGVKRPGDGGTGFYFARPLWDEILNYESTLLTTDPYTEPTA